MVIDYCESVKEKFRLEENRAVIFLLMQELLTCQKLSFYIFNLIFARRITFFSLYRDFRYNLYTTKYTKVI